MLVKVKTQVVLVRSEVVSLMDVAMTLLVPLLVLPPLSLSKPMALLLLCLVRPMLIVLWQPPRRLQRVHVCWLS